MSFCLMWDCLQGQASQPVPILPYADKVIRSQNHQNFQKSVFLLIFCQKHQVVVIFTQEARF